MTPEPSDRPVALITGASAGLGLALAHGLADRGWALVIDARGAVESTVFAARLRTVGGYGVNLLKNWAAGPKNSRPTNYFGR